MQKKLALVFTGAVSLGSFEAGAAAEIIGQIQRDPQSPFEIDLIVGTSAGALTGALSAIILAYDLNPKLLREAWLSLDLETLLDLNPEDKSILSSSKVRQQIEYYLRPPPKKKPIKKTQFFAVLTNLDGVEHSLGESGYSAKAISYEDNIGFSIGPGFDDWSRLHKAVQASSAFPGAFEHVQIKRRHARNYNYADGGIVNNQPLNLAVEKAKYLTGHYCPLGEERIFLVIEPSPPVLPKDKKDFGLLDVVSRSVWEIPRNQTLYRDLFNIEDINRRICWKNKLIKLLGQMNCSLLGEKWFKEVRELSGLIARYKAGQSNHVMAEQYLEAELRRIKILYKKELANNELGPMLYVVFLLDNITETRSKFSVRIEMLTPENPQEELSGVALGNFGGLVNRDYMAHDYRVGRRYARKWLGKEETKPEIMSTVAMNVPVATQKRVISKMVDNAIPLILNELGREKNYFGDRSNDSHIGTGQLFFILTCSMAKYLLKSINDFFRSIMKKRASH